MVPAFSLRGDVITTVRGLSPRSGLLLALALLCAVYAWYAGPGQARTIASVCGLTFAFLVLLIRTTVFLSGIGDRLMERNVARLSALDATPCFTTDDIGQITWRNHAGVERFRGSNATTLAAALGDHFTNPGAVVFRLQMRAESMGAAREDVVTRRAHLRVSVHRISQRRYHWRLEEFLDRHGSGRGANTLGLPMLVANKAGVILYANEAMRRLMGTRPKHLDRVLTNPTIRSGEEIEVWGVAGPVRAILAEIEGAGERREIYLLPVPERDEAAEAMSDFEHVPVALVRFRPDGSLLLANRAARDLLQLAPDEKPDLAEIVEGLGRSVRDWMDDVMTERLPGGSEVLQLRRGEGENFVHVTLRRIVESGRPGILAVLQDATDQKKLEEQFSQSQKMQSIGQLAGGIAHDFNNLLTAILGHCDLLMENRDPEDPDYADLVQVQQNANRAAGLVGQILAFSRKQKLNPQQIDLEEVLGELTHLLNRLVGERVTLELSHAEGLGMIRVDRQKLEQIIVNLVVNARDAMPAGGRIKVVTRALALSDNLSRGNATIPAGKYAVVSVQDNGTGIPPEVMDKVFEPFFTTKRPGEGTGLGLSTVYGIVKQSGGFIFLESELGKGTTFELLFPIHVDHEKRRLTLKAANSPGPVRRRTGAGVVLLVEDEAPVRAFASRALQLRGFTVVEAEDAETALATLEQSKLEFDIFVTDVVMPGMDGPSWVREALRTRPDVKVIFVSGYADEYLDRNRESIPDAIFLPKPFSLSDLTSTVEGALH